MAPSLVFFFMSNCFADEKSKFSEDIEDDKVGMFNDSSREFCVSFFFYVVPMFDIFNM